MRGKKEGIGKYTYPRRVCIQEMNVCTYKCNAYVHCVCVCMYNETHTHLHTHTITRKIRSDDKQTGRKITNDNQGGGESKHKQQTNKQIQTKQNKTIDKRIKE